MVKNGFNSGVPAEQYRRLCDERRAAGAPLTRRTNHAESDSFVAHLQPPFRCGRRGTVHEQSEYYETKVTLNYLTVEQIDAFTGGW